MSSHERSTLSQRILKYFSQEVVYESYKKLRVTVVGRMAHCHGSNTSVWYKLLRDRYTNGLRSDCSWRIAYRRPLTTITCTAARLKRTHQSEILISVFKSSGISLSPSPSPASEESEARGRSRGA